MPVIAIAVGQRLLRVFKAVMNPNDSISSPCLATPRMHLVHPAIVLDHHLNLVDLDPL